ENMKEKGVLTFEEAENKYGKLIHHNVAAEKLRLDSDGFLNYLREHNIFILEKGVHFVGSARGKRFIRMKDYEELKAFFNKQKEKKAKLKKDKSLVLGENIARWRGYDVEEFRLECEQGKWDHAVSDFVVNTYGK